MSVVGPFGLIVLIAAAWQGGGQASTLATGEDLITPPRQAWFPKAPPLPPPAGEVLRVTTVAELYRAAAEAKPGATILVADGRYLMPRYFELHTDNVTLRGESGRPERVILDGAASRHGELVAVSRASGVTIADLSIQNIKWNGFKINADSGVHRLTIRNCIIHNIWQRGVKGVPGVRREGRRVPPADCRIQYCLFYNDRPKAYRDDDYEAANPDRFGGNYIGGIDVMNAKGWVISDNVFVGIRGRTGEARGAIFVWNGSEDCVIERNVVLDCDTGICLGNSYRGPEWTTHATRVIVRNNFVTRCPETGILAAYTKDCRILNNTVHHPENRLRRLIRIVHDNDGLLVANNLLSGPPMRIETASSIDLRQNVEKDVTAYFVDAVAGNLRLRAPLSEAVDRAVRLDDTTEDIDRQPRGERPDIGAHEFAPRTRP